MNAGILRAVAGQTTHSERVVTLTTAQYVRVAVNDARRFCIVFANSESQTIWVTTNPATDVHGGIQVVPPSPLVFELSKFLSLVQGEWYARSDGVGVGSLTVIEIPITNA